MRAMAFVAIDEDTREPLGVVRLHADASHESGEYAILLRSDLKGRGLGWSLMQLIIEYGESEGLKRISGQILQENTIMLKCAGSWDLRSKPIRRIAVSATSR
jgi:acetyltransferase